MRTRSGQRHAELLAVARQLFHERGYEATSTREIASRLGLRPGSLYHYVDTKERLLEEIIAAVQAPGTIAMADALRDDAPAGDCLATLLRAHVSATAHDPIGAAILLRELRALPAQRRRELVAETNGYRRAVIALIEEGCRDGSIRTDVVPGVAAMAMLGALNWMHRWYGPADALSAVEVVERLPDLLLSGLVPDADGAATTAPRFEAVASSLGRRDDRYGEIVRAARQLFVERGYERTALSDVAARAGISKSALYHYVTGKDQLLFDLVREVQERACSVLDGLQAQQLDAVDKLVAAIRFHVHSVIQAPLEAQLALEQARSLAPPQRAEMRRLQRRYAAGFGVIVTGARRAADETDDRLATLIALGACNWVYRWYRPGQWTPDVIADGFAKVLVEGFAAGGVGRAQRGRSVVRL